MKSGSLRKNVSLLVTLGAASAVVVSFTGAASAAGTSPAVAMSHISKTYAHVGRAPRLPSGAHAIGAATTSKSISGAVALAPRNPAALAKAAAAVADPKSPSFHHYLSKGAFAAAYGPTTATINAVESTLRASHLTVTSVSTNRLLVHFKGTVGSAETAFRTHIANVRLASGRVGTETTSAVSFPSSLASSVVSVVGLNTLAALHTHVLRPTHPASVKPVTHNFVHPANSAAPCAAATGAATEFGGLTDDQIAHAYGADGLYSQGDFGAGQTVAIYELEPFAISDIKAFDTCYFGAAKATTMTNNVSTKIIDGGPGTGPGSGESALDIENVSAIAPAAKIEVYEAPNGVAGPLDLYNQIVQDDTADVDLDQLGRVRGAAAVHRARLRQRRERDLRAGRAAGPVDLRVLGRLGVRRLLRGRADPDHPAALDRRPGQPAVRHRGRWHDDHERERHPDRTHLERRQRLRWCRWRRLLDLGRAELAAAVPRHLVGRGRGGERRPGPVPAGARQRIDLP